MENFSCRLHQKLWDWWFGLVSYCTWLFWSTESIIYEVYKLAKAIPNMTSPWIIFISEIAGIKHVFFSLKLSTQKDYNTDYFILYRRKIWDLVISQAEDLLGIVCMARLPAVWLIYIGLVPFGFGWGDLPILKCTNYLVSLELFSNYETKAWPKTQKWEMGLPADWLAPEFPGRWCC